MNGPTSVKSRFEVNFIRLLEETKQIANGNKPKDWLFDKKMRNNLVLYGSATGTAEDIAERIGREASKYYFDVRVMSMNDCSLEDLMKVGLVLFVASTTGQGDDPDNMKSFFQTLWRNRSKRTLLEGLNFGVLGLGDSSYKKFNFSAKRLNKLLMLLGGKPVINIGLADDQHDLGPDFVVDTWLKNLWDLLLQKYPLPEGVNPMESRVLFPPKFQIKFVENEDIIPEISSHPNHPALDSPHLCKVTLNERKTATDHFQDVRLIEFDVCGMDYVHKPGDVLVVHPQNLEENVNEFINILGLEENKKFYFNRAQNAKFPDPVILPQPCTVRECVKRYLDIQAIPKRYFFELLSHFTTDETEREKFYEFTVPEGQEDLYNYCNRPKRSILEVLADFPFTNRNIPFEYLFDLVPPIKPRHFSIASSAKALPNRVQILVAVVKYSTILKRPRLGLCSNWLARLDPGAVVPLWIKFGSLTFPSPEGGSAPVLMIGPGTGCAPFRAYIQERIYNGHCDDLVLIFGCRGREKDYFFREEWEELRRKGKLELYCAFSRDQEEKVYVQHVMTENYERLWRLISKHDANIYYAGNAKRIPIDVYDALQTICQKSLGLTDREADQYMKSVIERKYQTESWT